MNSTSVSKVGVYRPSTPSKQPPDYDVAHTEAVCMVRDGEAEFINHKKAIRLKSDQTSQPSESPASRAALTGGGRTKGDGGDMHALAGMHFSGGYLSRRMRERLAGHGMVKS